MQMRSITWVGLSLNPPRVALPRIIANPALFQRPQAESRETAQLDINDWLGNMGNRLTTV